MSSIRLKPELFWFFMGAQAARLPASPQTQPTNGPPRWMDGAAAHVL
ncbi:MAG TPA: hypothetical protein VF193_12675 [Steroidobacter sp.]